MTDKAFIDRPPRIQPELPAGEIEIPKPPQREENAAQMLFQVALPLVTIVGYMVIASFGGRTLWLLIPMGLSVIASSGLAVYMYFRAKQVQADRDREYRQLLAEYRDDMERSHEAQRRFYEHNYPGWVTLFRIAEEVHASSETRTRENSRLGTRLWERRPGDPDFGTLRLGIGTRPSSQVYTLSQSDDYSHPLFRESMRLSDDSKHIHDAPITINLRQDPARRGEAAPTRHSVGISGQEPERVYQFTRALLFHFTAFHAPTDAKLFIAGARHSREEWRWAMSLPHTRDDQNSNTIQFETLNPGGQPAGGPENPSIKAFWKGLREILDRRRMLLEEKDRMLDATLPFILVVVDLLAGDLPPESSLAELEANPVISSILHEGPRLGFAILFLVQDPGKIPSSCQAVIEIDQRAPSDATPIFRYAEIGINSPRFIGAADLVKSNDRASQFANRLEDLSVRRSYGEDLSTNVTLLDLYHIHSLEELDDQVSDYWWGSKQPQNADWLNAAIGMIPGNEIRRLKFSTRDDGVHGMIAGSTGSGKSELLMTLIMDLAIHNDPSIINFVLVDYKGGAAFEPFRDLPHCVDIVTNLDNASTMRMFAAIRAELDRRQRINTETNSKHIVHYREKGLHLEERSARKPYPHLFIIIDEFAEMISDNAAFKQQLESITRLGRALGVTLILAAQRPKGVTDQMRANIKFRISLRVENVEESREMLRRADAAYLPPGIPGRGYLQVGNESLELLQIAHTGGEYAGEAKTQYQNVIWPNRRRTNSGVRAENPKLFEEIVKLLKDRNELSNAAPQWRPWPAALKPEIALDTGLERDYIDEEELSLLPGISLHPSFDEQVRSMDTVHPDFSIHPTKTLPLNPFVDEWARGARSTWEAIDWEIQGARVPVGILDNPHEAKQSPLFMNFQAGHITLFGASGWGKTTFLRTLLVSMTAIYSPHQCHAYVIDFGGRNLTVFQNLPHVGAVITSEEEDRVERLIRKLAAQLSHRQARLSEAGFNDIYEYNEAYPDRPIPIVLVAVDNFAEFRENFDYLVPAVVPLVREGRANGIHFMITAEQPNAIPSKLYTLFTERLTLRMADPGSYGEIVGRGVQDVSEIPGRGFVRVGRRPLEMQVAIPFRLKSPSQERVLGETEQLKNYAAQIMAAWEGQSSETLPEKIETLPANLLIETVERQIRLRAIGAGHTLPILNVPQVGRPAAGGALLGIEDLELKPYRVDLTRDGPHMVVLGPPISGKTTVLRTMALSLAHDCPPGKILLVWIDLQQRLFHYNGATSFQALPHSVQVIAGKREINRLVRGLQAEFGGSRTAEPRKTFVFIDNYENFSQEASTRELQALGRMAQNYGADGLHFVLTGSVTMGLTRDDLVRQVSASGFGLALQTSDAVQRLNGRIPRSLTSVELPIGRGFVVKSGRTRMVQVASPYGDQEMLLEDSLDRWIYEILKIHPDEHAEWPLPENTPLSGEAEAVPADIDWEALDRNLKPYIVDQEMTRSAKLEIAQQLGLEIPRKPL